MSAVRQPLTEQALFVGVQGKRLHYTQLGQVFRHYVEAAGVGERKRVTPHTLRTFSRRNSCTPARTCVRSRSCSGISTSTRRSATRA